MAIPSMLSTVSLSWIAIAVLYAYIIMRRKYRLNHPPSPPGPPADFLLGHARIIPEKHTDIFFYELSKVYGGLRRNSTPQGWIIQLERSIRKDHFIVDAREKLNHPQWHEGGGRPP